MMKRLLAVILVFVLALSLCGCQLAEPAETDPVPDVTDPTISLSGDPVETTDPSLPTETSEPTEPSQPTEATEGSQPANPAENTAKPVGYDDVRSFIFKGYQPLFDVELNLSKVSSNLYYFYYPNTGVVKKVFDFPVRNAYRCEIGTDHCVYYVKIHEPNVIYLYNVTQDTHSLCYKSDSGPITYMSTGLNTDELNFIVNNKQFVRMDINTGEEEVLLEAFYIEHGYFDEDTNTFGEAYIYWVGILDQDDTLDEYVYLIDTKEVREWPFL